MGSRNFEIRFNDLEFDKQEELVEEVKNSLLEQYKIEMEEQMVEEELDKWTVKPKEWKEAYCRIYAINYDDWTDEDEKSKDFQEYDWEYALSEYAEEQAKLKVVTAFKYVSVEVEL